MLLTIQSQFLYRLLKNILSMVLEQFYLHKLITIGPGILSNIMYVILNNSPSYLSDHSSSTQNSKAILLVITICNITFHNTTATNINVVTINHI